LYFIRQWWRKAWWAKTLTILVGLIIVLFGFMYGVALWYQHSQKGKPTTLGVSFIPDYASSLGLDPHQTFSAILNDLHPKQVRLVSYWSDIEPAKGTYNFDELDWEMQQAAAHGTKVTLAIGLRQPRWPECHAPSWVTVGQGDWQVRLNAFMTAVVSRYKNNPALSSYQLENEYFNTFGTCADHSRSRLTAELDLVKKLDADHPVIISRSNNYAGFAVRGPLPDIIGISVYRHVWNTFGVQFYFTYPFPSWYYAFLAGMEQILVHKPSVIHELQAEPWPPHGQSITDTPLSEQNKTFNADILQQNVKFAEQSGIKNIDLWGAEYWYYRAQILHDPSVWNTAKDIFKVQ